MMRAQHGPLPWLLVLLNAPASTRGWLTKLPCNTITRVITQQTLLGRISETSFLRTLRGAHTTKMAALEISSRSLSPETTPPGACILSDVQKMSVEISRSRRGLFPQTTPLRACTPSPLFRKSAWKLVGVCVYYLACSYSVNVSCF